MRIFDIKEGSFLGKFAEFSTDQLTEDTEKEGGMPRRYDYFYSGVLATLVLPLIIKGAAFCVLVVYFVFEKLLN